jgi:hypothetical protein
MVMDRVLYGVEMRYIFTNCGASLCDELTEIELAKFVNMYEGTFVTCCTGVVSSRLQR